MAYILPKVPTPAGFAGFSMGLARIGLKLGMPLAIGASTEIRKNKMN